MPRHRTSASFPRFGSRFVQSPQGAQELFRPLQEAARNFKVGDVVINTLDKDTPRRIVEVLPGGRGARLGGLSGQFSFRNLIHATSEG